MISLTNLNAMRSAAAMADSNADIKTSMERLSTGSKINSASDDAAGLAISTRMDTQILGVAKAIANGADGIGLLSTADGALGEVSSLLQRMRELSLQSANGTGTAVDRAYLNAEYQRLKDEIDRIGSQTQWNGMNIFDGVSFPGITQFQVGANANQVIGAEIQKISSASLSNSYDPESWSQLGSDIDGDSSWDYLGSSVSLSADGHTLAVGAPNADGLSIQSGQVKVLRYDSDSRDWVQLGSAIDGSDWGDNFGSSIEISGDGSTVVIGSSHHDGSGGSGSGTTRVYRYDDALGDWTQLGADLDGEAVGDFSGREVAISADGEIVAVGAQYNDGSGDNSGHVRVYSYSTAVGGWVQLGTDIDGEAAQDLAGGAISLSSDGSTIAIGSPGHSYSKGHVRIYKFDSDTATWARVGADIDGEAVGDSFGAAVSLSSDGTRVAVGAWENDAAGADSGHVRIYEYRVHTASWSQLGADIDGEAAGDGSGGSLSLAEDGSTLVVGAPLNDGGGASSGHARVFTYDASLGTWKQIGSDIDGEAARDRSGSRVSIGAEGSIVAIGATENDGNGNRAGQVRVYVTTHSLKGSSVITTEYANVATLSVDEALNNVRSMRSSYGAVINQLTYAMENLSGMLVNTESSKSRIADTDYAKESSNLVSAQIRNQGAKAMLAQANTDQQLTLSLLEDWL